MEDKTAKTIEFLRARLLAERSVSRAARQRAYELAKRVTELEKQLKYISLQRKKAEKATVDVLAILENHGRNDLSETFDSSSDQEQEETSSQHGETSTHVKTRESDTEGFSGSEVESSSRSLSWKSSKNSSSRFLEKKYMDASRRRRNSSLTSTGSSPRRVGKSCRQIRHKEHRSAGDVSRNDEGRTSSEGVGEEKDSEEVATSLCNGHGVKNHGSERDMERALEHQARFIARYEAEEKAQREWEDKFKENNGSTPDSCDPGTHSDVTEERDETKAPTPVPVPVLAPNPVPPPSCSNDKITPGTQEIPNIDTEPLLDPKNTDMDNKLSDNQNLKGTPQNSGQTQENPGELGSVLEALQQAKLSLKQNLEIFPLLQNRPSVEKFPVPDPFSSARLFRLPTDYEYGGTPPPPPRSNSLTYDPRLSLTSQSQFISSPYRDSPSRSTASVDDRFRMVPTFPYHEIRPQAGPSDSRLGVDLGPFYPRSGVSLPPDRGSGVGPSAFDQRMELGPQYTGDRYTRSADGPSQNRFLYDDYMRPNTYK